MSSIQKISQHSTNKKPLITPKSTGYAAAGAIGLCTIRAFSKSKSITKTHKILGFIATGLTLLHIGCVEYLHHKYKKM